MKTKFYNSLFICAGTALVSLIISGGINNGFEAALAEELSNFDSRSIYAVLGLAIAGIAIYVFANRNKKEEAGSNQESANYSYQRPHHHRAVVKKTA